MMILMHKKYGSHGFTLVELMIVVSIIAILAAVAVPSYQSQGVRARRADAQAAVLGLAQAMERHFTENSTYASAVSGGAPVATVYPSQIPLGGGTKYYNLEVVADATTYTLIARPIAGTAQDGDGYVGLRHTGQRGWDQNNDDNISDSESCWESSCD